MKPGEVRWIDLPDPYGHEQAGHRPAIVLQEDHYAGALPTTLIVPLTSAAAAARLPGTLPIAASSQNGLRNDSVALVFQFRVLDRRRVHDALGTIEDDVLETIYKVLDQILGRI